MTIKLAAISPHAPILLPDIGSKEDHRKVSKTLRALQILGEQFRQSAIEEIIISSPHQDWGFKVPLFFLDSGFKGKITPILTGSETLKVHYQLGQNMLEQINQNKSYAIIASGDLSHCLKEDGPYGFHPDGPKFDRALIANLQANNLPAIFQLEEQFPFASDCGLRSFCFALGILNAAKIEIKPNILSYEGPFGVGYLVASLI